MLAKSAVTSEEQPSNAEFLSSFATVGRVIETSSLLLKNAFSGIALTLIAERSIVLSYAGNALAYLDGKYLRLGLFAVNLSFLICYVVHR